MLTVRIHLDDVTEENGPLRVLAGSHREDKALQHAAATPLALFCNRGDVLLIRPLVAHSSAASRPGTRRHRRILHLEFAAAEDLPDGFRWHDYIRGDQPQGCASEPTRVG